MVTEEYRVWTPVDSIPATLHCEALHDDYEGFRILLRSEDTISPVLRVFFDAPLAYRNLDEGSLIRTLARLRPRGINSLFIVDNSTWLKWFLEESCGIYEGRQITHYAFLTPNDCIDVLSEIEPRVEWL